MNFAELMLLVCCALGLVVLIIVAAGEPRYTWRSVVTLDELLEDMQRGIDNFARAIGEKLIPVMARAAQSMNDAIKDLKL